VDLHRAVKPEPHLQRRAVASLLSTSGPPLSSLRIATTGSASYETSLYGSRPRSPARKRGALPVNQAIARDMNVTQIPTLIYYRVVLENVISNNYYTVCRSQIRRKVFSRQASTCIRSTIRLNNSLTFITERIDCVSLLRY